VKKGLVQRSGKINRKYIKVKLVTGCKSFLYVMLSLSIDIGVLQSFKVEKWQVTEFLLFSASYF
jgi:hypothetical protein